MNFGKLEYIWLMMLIPGALLLGQLRSKVYRARLDTLASPGLIAPLIGDPKAARQRLRYYTILLVLITSLLVLALLGPQWGFQWRESKRRGGDIALAIDVSQSMLANDISPTRLDRAKHKITDLLGLLKGDRVSLIAFSGVAFIETPLTLDYAAFRQFLPLVDPDLIPVKGSNIEVALRKSLESLGVKAGASPDAARGAAVILLTDGEELEGDLEGVGKLASSQGVKIYVLGIGTPEGAPIPTGDGYKKDKEGKVVITRLRPDVLEQIALKTGGTYVQSISGTEDIERIYSDNVKSSLRESEKTFGKAKRWNEYYQLPLSLALLILVFGFWGKFHRAKKGTVVLLLLFLSTPLQAKGQSVEELGAVGSKHFEKGNFQKAEDTFQSATKRSESDSRLWLGLGASQYRQGKFEDAQASFAQAMQHTEEPKGKAAALYNRANSLVQAKRYQEAIEGYEQSLKLNPDDKEAVDNLAYAKRLLEEQQQQQKKSDQNKDQSKTKQNQKNEKQQQSDSSQSSSEEQSSQEHSSEENSASNSNNQSSESGTSSSSASDEGSSSSVSESEEASSSSSDSSDVKGAASSSSEGASSSEAASEQQSTAAGGESSSETREAQAGEEGSQGEPRQDELETLLKSVEEKFDANTQFRVKKALEQLKAEKRKLPEKDW